jgi:hypothetical protein
MWRRASTALSLRGGRGEPCSSADLAHLALKTGTWPSTAIGGQTNTNVWRGAALLYRSGEAEEMDEAARTIAVISPVVNKPVSLTTRVYLSQLVR